MKIKKSKRRVMKRMQRYSRQLRLWWLEKWPLPVLMSPLPCAT